MKLKALLLACAVAGAFASFALADDGHGKHGRHDERGATTRTTTTTTGTTTTVASPGNCVRVELRGTLASVSASSFTLNVRRVEDNDRAGSAGPLVGHTVTIAVDASTQVQWAGKGTLTGPNVGDSARVKARSCGTPATLTAQRVNAEGLRGERHDAKNHK